MDQQPNTNALELAPLPLQELAALLVRHYGLHVGLWDVALQMQVAIGQLGPAPDKALPGAMIGVSGIGLARAAQAGPLTVDAAKINPES